MVRASGDQGVAISPDGERLAFTARRDDTVHLYVRSLDSTEAIEVPESAPGQLSHVRPRFVRFMPERQLT